MPGHRPPQAREATLSDAVAALQEAYTTAPSDGLCNRLSAACRDQLAALRRGVDAFELAADDEVDDADAAAAALVERRAAFDRCVTPRQRTRAPCHAHVCDCTHTRCSLRIAVRDASLAAHKAARDLATREVRALDAGAAAEVVTVVAR